MMASERMSLCRPIRTNKRIVQGPNLDGSTKPQRRQIGAIYIFCKECEYFEYDSIDVQVQPYLNLNIVNGYMMFSEDSSISIRGMKIIEQSDQSPD
mmetsp:Transcript_35974/g.41536  ORF Transcript_35974/g.41536 Transcript_35974/m.41536 type:complete len:96 (+) Transcript_35974:128-415(+)